MIGTTHVNKHQAKADMSNHRWEKRKTIIHVLKMSDENRDSPTGAGSLRQSQELKSEALQTSAFLLASAILHWVPVPELKLK